jgi:hypothetical protein
VQAGAGNGGERVAAGRQLGNAWREGERAAGEGNRARTGRGRRVGVISAGGGMAAAAERRPEAAHCTGDRGGQSRSRARGRRREGRGPEDLFGELRNFRDPTVKKDFPLI